MYGVIKLRLSGGYNYNITTGNLEYSYLFGGAGGTIWRSERHCTRADGLTPNYFAAGDVVWNATESCWAIPIFNRQSRNYFLIDFEFFSNVTLTDNYEITLSGWEAWGTQPPISYPSYMTLGIKITSPEYDLDVNGTVRMSKWLDWRDNAGAHSFQRDPGRFRGINFRNASISTWIVPPHDAIRGVFNSADTPWVWRLTWCAGCRINRQRPANMDITTYVDNE